MYLKEFVKKKHSSSFNEVSLDYEHDKGGIKGNSGEDINKILYIIDDRYCLNIDALYYLKK